jgi:ABC-type antimicrobial peptide transport system permease subunit
MPPGSPDMAFTPTDSKLNPLPPVINSFSDLFTINQYAFYNLFGQTLGGFLWVLFLMFLFWSLGNVARMIFRWTLYDIVYPKPKKHHPK